MRRGFHRSYNKFMFYYEQIIQGDCKTLGLHGSQKQQTHILEQQTTSHCMEKHSQIVKMLTVFTQAQAFSIPSNHTS